MMPLPVPQVDNTETEEDRLVMDPLGEETLALWNDVARTNTEIFRTIFRCVPDDTGKMMIWIHVNVHLTDMMFY